MSNSLGVDCPCCGSVMQGPSCDSCSFRESMSVKTCDSCGDTVPESDIAVEERQRTPLGVGGRVRYCNSCVPKNDA